MASADSLCPWRVSSPPPILKDTYGVRRLPYPWRVSSPPPFLKDTYAVRLKDTYGIRRLPVTVACIVPATILEGYL